ncbi:MAG: hypothetical protein JXA67_02060 [Micromonosporaceae bacterium]|nr:hypothetical protein [Micromonosporaceae bacterium]
MRLTVGPLPSVVYWRRRAAVLGVLLLLITFVVVRCASGDEAPPSAERSPSPGLPDPTSSTSLVAPPPTLSASVIGGEDPLPSAESVGPGDQPAPATGGGKDPVQPRSAVPTCSDADVSLLAAAEPTPAVYGGTVSLSLTVVNTSGHECSRDIGSGQQELRVQRDETLVWSSDRCSTSRTSDVRTFGAGVGVRFTLQWNTHTLAPDMCKLSSTPAEPASYEVVARLGSKVSEPFPFLIRK